MTRIELVELARSFGLPDVATAHEPRPAVALVPADESRSRSRLGGVPLLPPGFAWPRWSPKAFCEVEFEDARKRVERNPELPYWRTRIEELEALARQGPRPLAFVAQLDLADLVGLPLDVELPRAGLVSFFLELEHGASSKGRALLEPPWRVVFFGADEELVSTEAPADFGVRSLGAGVSLSPRLIWTLPEALQLEDGDEPVDWCEDERIEQLFQAMYERGCRGAHQLGGHHWQQQSGDVREYAGWFARGYDPGWNRPPREVSEVARTEARDWELLLQVSEDGGGLREWSGVGTFWLRREDLAAGRFEKAIYYFENN